MQQFRQVEFDSNNGFHPPNIPSEKVKGPSQELRTLGGWVGLDHNRKKENIGHILLSIFGKM